MNMSFRTEHTAIEDTVSGKFVTYSIPSLRGLVVSVRYSAW